MTLDRRDTDSESNFQLLALAQTSDWIGCRKTRQQSIASIHDSEYIQGLKVQFIDNALSLSEAFARQAIKAAQHGSLEAAGRAHDACGRFCEQALEVIGILGDAQKAGLFTAKVRTLTAKLNKRLSDLSCRAPSAEPQ